MSDALSEPSPTPSTDDTTEEGVAAANPDAVGQDGDVATPAVVILTEEALSAADVEKIVTLHAGEATTYRVLVPADTKRNMLSGFLNHLSLFEMREALESLRPVNRDHARVDAETALRRTLEEFESRGIAATGEVTLDDPIPAVEDEVARLDAREVVVVTEPHAVEDTFHTDWASKAREQLGLPVLHMYAGDWRLG